MKQSRQSWITLSLVAGLGVTTFWRLVAHFSTPQAVLEASARELLRVKGVRQSSLKGLLERDRTNNLAEPELVRLDRLGGRALVWGDDCYPALLTRLTDPPPVLYCLGNLGLLQKPSVAVVGSRAASSYGLRTAANLADGLARAGVVVVSGLAAGIDAAAHRGALAAADATVAVLGCGLDRIYPRQNGELYREIATKGLLISEYPLGTRPDGYRFPARNRIIAGMAAGVIVVEAARKSGSLITAQMALDFGREVFAVPGQIDSCKSEGCHLLIKSGASLVLDVGDILDELGFCRQNVIKDSSEKVSIHREEQAARLLQALDSYPVGKDELVEKTGLAVERINELCLVLELEGVVENLPGGQVRRISSNKNQ
ncbi:MAG: DNA-protecting protein DprA [Deltaproteobacteria bacterium]|nr:MAG: DNA-protecting protein DprA [Deltaproteobacteria bacterium]